MIYVHWLNPVDGGRLFLPGVKQRIKKATLLSEGTVLKFKQQDDGLLIETNGVELGPDQHDYTIGIKIKYSSMKLFRWWDGDVVKPGLIIDDVWYDASLFGEDYGEIFFENGGMERLKSICRCQKGFERFGYHAPIGTTHSTTF